MCESAHDLPDPPRFRSPSLSVHAQAIDILRTLTGEVDVGAHEIAGGMYYLMGHKRGERGDNPRAEAEEHAGLPALPSEELDMLLYWLPLATTFAYTPAPWDLQRLLKQQDATPNPMQPNPMQPNPMR